MSDSLVAKVFKIHGTASISVDEDTSLEGIIGTFAQQPSIRGVFLIDKNLRFVCMITRIDLIRWTHLQLSGGKGMDRVPIWDILRLVEARKAKDIAMSYRGTISVKETDTLQSALNQMLVHEEDILPVLDQEGKVLGDLRLSEVLWWFLSSDKKQET
jgi:CBS domain-containing protein